MGALVEALFRHVRGMEDEGGVFFDVPFSVELAVSAGLNTEFRGC